MKYKYSINSLLYVVQLFNVEIMKAMFRTVVTPVRAWQ